jgi:hypothetical protein
VGDHDARGARVEGRRQADFVVPRNADDDHRLALRVVLGSMDAARQGQNWALSRGDNWLDLLVEGRAVKDAVLNVNPDKVGLGRGHDLNKS